VVVACDQRTGRAVATFGRARMNRELSTGTTADNEQAQRVPGGNFDRSAHR
jgi:hypothetical protein